MFISKRVFDKWSNILYRDISKLAREDYDSVNKKSNGEYYKKHRPYRLSQDTLELLEMYHTINKSYYNNIELTLEDETKIKDYMLRRSLIG